MERKALAPNSCDENFFLFFWLSMCPTGYYFICDQDAWFCLPRTNTTYTLRIIFQDFFVHGHPNSKNHKGLKFLLRRKLQNEATLDYSGTPPKRTTDSLFIRTVREVLPTVRFMYHINRTDCEKRSINSTRSFNNVILAPDALHISLSSSEGVVRNKLIAFDFDR